MDATATQERQEQEKKKVSNTERGRVERGGYAALAALSISSGQLFGPDLRGSQN